MSVYEAASSQTKNLQKSKMFCSTNVNEDLKGMIIDLLGVRLVLGIENTWDFLH